MSDAPVVTPGPTSSVVTTVVTTPPVAAGSYVVEPGDTLSVIAEQFGVTVAALSEANGITDVNTIKPGQELIIPGS
ncbi:MAG: LysM peptidoglycan-binding domain-containing protein [Acidimicrobiales bacterium]